MISTTWFKPAALAIVIGSAAALSACGTTPGERAVTGGALGAAGGAAIGAAAGNAGAGALIGAGVGAATGAFTSPDQINLGPTPWHSAAYYRRHHYAAYRHRVWCEHHPRACRSVATR